MTSKDVLALAKRVEAQSVQAAVLNDLTVIKAFDKIKKGTESMCAKMFGLYDHLVCWLCDLHMQCGSNIC